MATRICFISQTDKFPVFRESEIDFQYHSGFSVSQKQKSIKSLHSSVRAIDDTLIPLEISTKSTNPIGVALSAFNLTFYDSYTKKNYPLENIFQSSKVFEHGGPYKDLLLKHPRDAKRDERLKTSGKLLFFSINDSIWELNPTSMFYDWIYISALIDHPNLADKIVEYNAFTDIEFNHKKSFNCQARSAAIYVGLVRQGQLHTAMLNKENFKKIYPNQESVFQNCFEFGEI